MADIDKEITVKVKAEDDTAKATQSAKQRLRDLQKQMLELEQAGQKNTDQFRKMAAEAGSLKDAIGDTSAQVKALASDTRTLDTFTSAIQGIAGGFAVAQGAAALFGEENEDVQKAMMKVQAALALVNGATALANTLNKDSALMVNLNAAAQRAYALAVGTSTGALKAFRIALVTTGVGALVVALGFAVDAMLKFTKGTQGEVEKQKELKKAMEDTVGTIEYYERKLKAFGATDADISKIRLANLKRDSDQYQALLDADIAKHGKRNDEYQKNLNDQLDLLKTQMKEQQNVIDAADAARLEAQKQAQKKRYDAYIESQKQLRTADVEYVNAGVDGLELLMNTAAKLDRELVVIKKGGIEELNKSKEYADRLENMREQRRVDQAKSTLQGIADLTTLFAGKSEKAQRRAFDINKKASMGTAIIDGITATQKAFKSAPPPLSYILAAAAAAAAAVRVKAISNQQFQGSSAADVGGGGSSAPPTTGGFASGGGAMNPNSQLLNPNTGQPQGQPLRAYVVESDVSGVQNRLRAIRQFAQLGS